MGLQYRDAENIIFDMHVQDGPEGTKQPVHGLAEDIVEVLEGTQTAAESLAALIDAGTLPVGDEAGNEHLSHIVQALATVDGDLVTPRLTTLIGHVDNVETKLDTLHADLDSVETKLDTLHADLDGVETALSTLHSDLDGVEGKLDTLIAGVVVATMPTPVNSYGQGSVGAAAAQIDSGNSLAVKYGVRIKNLHATQDLYVGFNNSVNASTGVKIRPYEEAPFPVANRNALWLFGSGASTTYCYWTA